MRIDLTNNIYRLIFVGLTFVVPLSASFAQTKPAEIGPATLARIGFYLDGIERSGFTGNVIVERNGKIVVSRTFGLRDIERNLRNESSTVFDIGSLTKQFTAAAILKLEMLGKLNTDDKIGKFFPNVPEDKAAITIHDLLRHSSGLRGDIGGDYDRINREEFIAKLMASPLESTIGERFRYSNIGYSLLAMIVEKTSGRDYETFLSENLLRPAGMHSTGYSLPAFDPAKIAVGYRWDGMRWGKPTEKLWDDGAPFWHLKGNGGILSTTEDLAKWSTALRGDKILSKYAKKKLHHPRLRPNETDNPFYAYGWDILRTKRNTLVASHNGTNNFFYADMSRFLDERLTIIHMVNKGIPSFIDVNKQIARIIFEPAYVPSIPAAESKENQVFSKELSTIAAEKGVDKAFAAYSSRKTGLDAVERFINGAGYDLMDGNKLRQAIEVFRLNTILFPRSSNAFDSLGEAYMGSGTKPLAIANYQKSLELDPANTNAERMLKRLSDQ
ncbi:MAG TPA: serine hydrolase [Pyrinomonadaceae bacterium]|nr:serine hydrolase [Pyrinomonadaceae bacterium]